jgi:hypothetical protein
MRRVGRSPDAFALRALKHATGAARSRRVSGRKVVGPLDSGERVVAYAVNTRVTGPLSHDRGYVGRIAGGKYRIILKPGHAQLASST